jgi:ABC-type multidrug transport system fused ATPase/permease subunit
MRQYDPQEGKITVDGVDIKDIDIESFHNQISVVDQNPVLFNSTLKDNIAYGA